MRRRRIEDPDGKFLSISQVCARLNTGRYTANRLAQEAGAIARFGGVVRVDIAKLDDYINSQCMDTDGR